MLRTGQASLPVTLAADTVHTEIVVDSSGGIKIENLVDAAGAGQPPVSGAATGFGGSAPQRHPARRSSPASRSHPGCARPELDKDLAYLRAGDVFVITRLSRAMRSLKHLLALADELRARGAGLVVLKQQIDTTTPQGRLVFHLLGAIDEFQRELIVERTREGLAAARARGRTGGRKPKLNARQAATVRRMYAATGPDGKRQHTVAEIAEAVGVHRTTVYDYLRKED